MCGGGATLFNIAPVPPTPGGEEVMEHPLCSLPYGGGGQEDIVLVGEGGEVR